MTGINLLHAAANWAYHNHDALGSLRQLTDSEGTVTLTKSYLPYGDELSSSGVGASSYGFTGEMYDNYIKLIYLRSRYYAPETGRFLTRDTWQGDYYKPMSYNLWLYTYGNPVSYTDPSGYFPTKAGIEDEYYSYSCNCGWLDWGHAGPRTAKQIISKVYYEPRFEPGEILPNVPFTASNYKVVYVSLTQFDPLFGRIPIFTVSKFAVVRRHLDLNTKQRIALSIFKNLENEFEVAQGQLGASSSFAEEDLASNLIGFYIAIDLVSTDGTSDIKISPEELRSKVSPVCDVLNIEKSLSILNEPYGEFQKVKTWGNPRLKPSCLIDDMCGTNRQWPSSYSSIQSEPTTVNGKWWWYRGHSVDGGFHPSDKAGVYYLINSSIPPVSP